MTRQALIDAVSERLAGRRLVWAGVRAEDAEPLASLPAFDSSFAIIGRYRRRPSVTSLAYEDLSGRRVDLETWDIDDERDQPEAHEFRRALLRRLASPSALVTYRPSRFLSAIWFARRDRCLSLGLFGGHQQAFEHKPWVEHELSRLGVATIPWTYIADEDQWRTLSMVEEGPVMLRRSRTSGGEGLVRVDAHDDVATQWLDSPEGFVSVAPFLDGGIPVNIGGTVWHTGEVTVHLPSVQLIGIDVLGRREFGYCGNDFGAAAALDTDQIDTIDTMTRTVGGWLARHGYIGTFGVDYLVHEGAVLFTEINPRFQGSTCLSSRISIGRDEPCLMLEHVAAHLGLDPPPTRSLTDRLRDPPAFSNVVVHSTLEQPAHLDVSSLVAELVRRPEVADYDVMTRTDLLTDPGATVVRFATRERITDGGFDLREPLSTIIRTWWSSQQEQAPPVATTEGTA